MENSDSEILALFGDMKTREKGFQLLIVKYQQRIYWQIRKMVNIHEDTDDVMQNVFIKVWNNLGKFKGNSQLYTWIYRISVNETLAFLKHRNKRRSISVDETEGYFSDRGTEANLGGDEITLKLEQAIETLPDKQKLVFNMRYYEEMPYEQMSQILETSVGALKASYHHAAKKIESFLTGN